MNRLRASQPNLEYSDELERSADHDDFAAVATHLGDGLLFGQASSALGETITAEVRTSAALLHRFQDPVAPLSGPPPPPPQFARMRPRACVLALSTAAHLPAAPIQVLASIKSVGVRRTLAKRRWTKVG